MRYIVSTCGTSLITNNAPGEDRAFIRSTANLRKCDLGQADRSRIDNIIEQRRQMLLDSTLEERRMLSAEMNGLIGLMGGNHPQANDIFLFLHTDTYQGGEIAQVLSEAVKHDMGGRHSEKRLVRDLNMSNLEEFHLGLSELVRWAHQECRVYREKGYEVIFNLVGGFKTFQGFMQILGMLYADSSIYIFEGEGSPLLRIPSLPLQLDAGLENVFRENLTIFRTLLWMGGSSSGFNGIPETLLMNIEGEYTFSPWGEIAWNRFREDHYGDGLLDAPTGNIRFSEGFSRKTRGFDRERLKTLNERIDDLARFMGSPSRPNPRRLDFKQLKGDPLPPSTHEFDAWADKGAWRCFCHFEGEDIVIDNIGPGIGH